MCLMSIQLQPITDDRLIYLANLAHEDSLKENFSYFVRKAGIRLDGKPFTFAPLHAYLEEPYRSISDPNIKEVVSEKAAQMGITVMEMLFDFWGMKYGRFPKGVLYLLPTEHHMEKVSKTKIQPIIDENPLLQSWVQRTDSTTQKRIGQASLILHGMTSKLSIKSYSVDREALDEVEEVEDWIQVSLARERMSHSEVEWQGYVIKGGSRHLFSVPSVPEYGIDKFFVGKSLDDGRGYEVDPSDQRFWHLQCSHCNEWTCFDEDFPECLIEVNRQAQKAIRICRGCRQELPLISKGEWVAKMPGQSTVGYHYSQLFSAYVNPWDILDRFQKKKDLVILYNDKLGLSYVESDARLEIAEVMALCGSQPMLTAFRGPCGMGVDQPKQEGQNFHVTIACKRSDSLRQILFIGIVHTWAAVSELMEKFNVSRCVVDGLPDQSKAREFADAHKNRVFLSYYAEKQKGGHKWNEKDFTVSLDRTETLNSSARDIHEQKVILPVKSMVISIFAKHCHNMARKSEEDKDTGTVRQTWVKTGPDHFRHAWNYCCVAMEEIAIAPSDNKRKNIPYMPNLAKSYAVNLDYRRGQGQTL